MAALNAVRTDDRGQLLLVGAFILAVLLVALAVVLNAAVYTETLAASSNDRADVSDTVQYRDDTERGLSGLVAAVNDDAYATRSEADTALRTGFTDWDAISAREQAATGRATAVSVDAVSIATNVSQTNASLSFANASGSTEWTPVQNAASTSRFNLNVAPPDLAVPTDPSDPAVLDAETFHVELVETDTGQTWQVFVFQSPSDPSQVTVAVHEPGATTVEPYNASWDGTTPVVVDIVNGTVGDTDAPELRFLDELSGQYSVAYSNADRASGTYTLVVDGDVSTPADYSTAPAAGPTARAVVTQLDATLRYELSNLSYETPITVVAGGFDG
ncbi:hypothetical protein [Haloferax sp. ATB1]|uniref:DUF7261 family protein n=1 Tax=Haloferax sp. ATB1 TaxID=1508454 RepID=UPI0005B1D987|nr:hypothetical protein [Haloferax sp. ATB1]